MFYLRKVSEDRPDLTAAYIIDISCFVDSPKKFTVKEFVANQIKNNCLEFGSIYFGPKYRTSLGYKYSNFKDVDLILERYGNRVIKKPIKCDGILAGHMDYWIELEEEIDE